VLAAPSTPAVARAAVGDPHHGHAGAASTHDDHHGAPITIGPDDPRRGMIYAGLRPGAAGGPCAGLLQTADGACTHGPDDLSHGHDVRTYRAPLASRAAQVASAVQCSGDGTSGSRVQMMYVRTASQPDHYAATVDSIRAWAVGMDDIVDASAQETRGVRHIRFVTAVVRGGCVATVLNVVLPDGSLGADFNTTVQAIQAKGYTAPNRKYLAWSEGTSLCGIGQIYPDDSAGPSNLNNGTARTGLISRVDRACWLPELAAHEMMHNMGAVQPSAPHATRYYHCTDDGDVMCYVDGSGEVVTQTCPPAHENRLDCNHDDYFSTAPGAGSYLRTHWNTADSSFFDQFDTAVAPGPPATPTATAGPGRARVAWTKPTTGGAVDAYLVTSAPGGVTKEVPAATTAVLFTGLTNDTAYRFTVVARNTIGSSPPSAPSAAVVPTPYAPFASLDAFIVQQWLDLTGARPTPGDVETWHAKLSSGAATPADLPAALLPVMDVTHRYGPVTRLYLAYFLRIPDKGGLDHWVAKLASGGTLDDASQAFASSAEFVRRYGSLSNHDFVLLIYKNVLARTPDDGGVTYWTGQLDSGQRNRGQVMTGFSESAEYRTKIASKVAVVEVYRALLQRVPTAAEASAAVTKVDGGATGLHDVIAGLLGSSEYLARFS
ncbi:MAG: Ricin lectin, partial [Acidimicrobiales bacterium]|nr:Ricin lectin [Acidimicrobiales bacterium]